MTVTELCNEKHAFQQTFFVHRTMLDSTIYVELLRGKKNKTKKNMLPVNVGFFVVLV